MDGELLNKVANYVLGTCKNPSTVIEYFNLDVDENDIEDLLLDVNIEMCEGCGYWFESSDLIDDDMENPGYCNQCRD
jgi:predicted Zn-ribbon and HTH transcriptional regulator